LASAALANLYIRLSSLSSFNEEHEVGLEFARRAAETADLARADLPCVWSRNFMGIAEAGLGRVEAGFKNLDESFRGAMAGRYGFQIGNAVYNALWIAVHLGRGDQLALWTARIPDMPQLAVEPWPHYARGLVALAEGRVYDALRLGLFAMQKAHEAGHEKMEWRSRVLYAQALAENLQVDEAARQMPPVTSRVDSQDVIYDAMPRIRCRIAAGDLAGADAEARLIPISACSHGSPIDAMAEGSHDAAWLAQMLDALPARGETLASPRIAVARGRQALYAGDHASARRFLGHAATTLETGGFLLDAWHAGNALAEAEHAGGEIDAAAARLSRVALHAEIAGARLAAKLARETAGRLGLRLAPAAKVEAEVGVAPRVVTGERMVTVLFADVRGYSQMTGRTPPAELADRISSLQRWATQEVERRHGIVDKFAGDAVMATFNVAGQSVDHTLQALRAAVAIIDKAGLAGLPVGAGVAVGPAVVGNLASSANVSVLGDVTNLASRLQASAEAGEVVFSEEVHRRVREWLATQQIEAVPVELSLKGFAAPVSAYKVTTEVVAGASA